MKTSYDAVAAHMCDDATSWASDVFRTSLLGMEARTGLGALSGDR